MSIEVKVPQLPESVADATLVNWHKKPGDRVSRDENLVDLETDKVVLEVPAPADGVIKELRAEDGATVESGDVIAVLEEGEAPADDDGESGEDDGAKEDSRKDDSGSSSEDGSEAGKSSGGSGSAKLSPSVRRLMEEHDLDPSDIEGSGKDGRITKADVMAYLDEGGSKETDGGGDGAREEAAPSGSAGAIEAAIGGGQRNEERVPMTRLRSRIAERMVEAQVNAAMLTSFNEVDLSAVMALRKKYQERFVEENGVKLGFMSFFIKAACEALKKYPVVNASVDGNDILYHDYFDVGVAVSTEKGLLVPVLRDADRMSFAEIEQTLGDLAKRAREGKIGMDELTGGTFTITNGGVFGSLVSTPILNPPQSAILGMHAIKERPVVVDGEVVARPMMYIALTYDHRIIDGREAVLTLVSIKESLEDPARLLLQV